MPVLEPPAGTAERFALRHIGPQTAVYSPTGAAPLTPGQQVLAQTLVARPLPSSPLPTSPDLATGSWTGRLNDSGEATLTFPNAEASDGVSWRSRFDPTGHLQFIEVYNNGELDFTGVIDQIPTVDATQVQLHCSDGWWLLKKAYERDWLVTLAPRDVIERATQLWVPVTTSAFPAGSTIGFPWTITNLFGGTTTIGPNGGLVLSLTSTLSSQASIQSPAVTVPATGTWTAQATVQVTNMTGAIYLQLQITESTGFPYVIALQNGTAKLSLGAVATFTQQIAAAPSYSLRLESDGQWVYGFVNGQLVGCGRRQNASTTSLQTQVFFDNPGPSPAATATVTGVLTEALQPFLMRGNDKGDYALPGDASTYPTGGLHARYFNDLDLQNTVTVAQLASVLAPTRTQAYGSSSSVPEYMDQQDPGIAAQDPPGFSQSTPGPGTAALAGWSAVWFGAVYLKLSAGSYIFSLTPAGGSGQAMRLWVGNTVFGTQIVDGWTFSNGAHNVTVTQASLAGVLPYGAGAAIRDGWYPIKLETAVSPTAALNAPSLAFTPPVSYTDPGGTALTGGVSVSIPSSSLSPLGCVDQRYQGVSHYDLAQQTGEAYGYQLSVEPQQLESGLFPGVLAPRWREGHDTDIVLKPDRGPRQDGEGMLNPSSGLDATDFASSLQGNGAGFQNGNTGQLQGFVYDPPTLEASLFDAQAWNDFSDAAYASLLEALLNSRLGLQLAPWELISADPVGSPRKAFTWPLPGAVANMRWRPGDGLRIQNAEINIYDTTPRQMLVVTRNFLPLGISGTTVTFAERPRTAARTLKRQLYTATRWQRNYQRQLVTLTGNAQTSTIPAGALDPKGGTSLVLLPGDQLVHATLRVPSNSASMQFQVYLNTTNNVTGALGGPWTLVPLNLPLNGVLSAGLNLLQIKNIGASPSTFEYQMLIEVLR